MENMDDPGIERNRQSMSLPQHPSDLIQGTLDLLILKTLAIGPNHGWAVAHRIQEASHETLQVTQGSLYPALQRLQQKGWIDSEWGMSEKGRRAKFYYLTKLGEAELARQIRRWRQYSVAVELVLQMG